MAHNVDYILLHTLAVAMNNVIAQYYISNIYPSCNRASSQIVAWETPWRHQKEHAKIGATSKIAWVPHTRTGRAFKVGAHAVNPVTNANIPTLRRTYEHKHKTLTTYLVMNYFLLCDN